MIDLLPNQTLVIQIVIFLIATISLNFLIFRPILRILERRVELSVGGTEEAQKINAQTEALIADHQQKMQRARQEGLEKKDRLKKEGEKQATELRQKIQQDLEQTISKARQEISQQTKECQLILNKTVRDFAKQIAQKLLGREVSS